jgi:L,D-transpeptidase ErfK/SrfK
MFLRTLLSLVFLITALTATAKAQELPQGDLVGTNSTYTVVKGDSLAAIARRNRIGFVELLAANPALTSSVIKAGQSLVIPGQHLLPAGARTGIVVNLSALRLFRFGGDGTVMTFPISVGREGWDTPTGVTQIVQKRKDPTWTVPASIRAQDPKLPAVVPAGPDNPLGQYALSLGWPGYLIHGTNAPSSIGKPASHGCMRMYPEDIESLFGAVEVGDTVTVIDTPITLGQSGGKLYLQVTPTRDQAKEIAAYRPVFPLTAADAPVMDLMTRVSALKASGAEIDDKAVEDAIARHDGMPVVIGTAPQENNTAPDSVNHI